MYSTDETDEAKNDGQILQAHHDDAGRRSVFFNSKKRRYKYNMNISCYFNKWPMPVVAT